MKWIRLACLFVCLPIGACNCNKSAPDAADKDEGASKPQDDAKQDDGKQDGAKPTEPAEKIADDIYEDFNFEEFEQDERAKFVRVAKAELCPCPERTDSLHECLQKRDTRCGVAEQSASLIGVMVKGEYSETDILDKVAEFVEATKKEHNFDLTQTPYKGNPKAKVVIVEFADFQCPFCREASKLMADIAKKHGDDVAIFYKHYPLVRAHEHAELAARAAVAAHRQGRFWPMHDLLFDNQKSLNERKITALAQQVGLNMNKFNADLMSPEVAAIVARDRSEGDGAGLTGTPTLFVNGRRYLGDLTEESISGAIKATAEHDGTTEKD